MRTYQAEVGAWLDEVGASLPNNWTYWGTYTVPEARSGPAWRRGLERHFARINASGFMWGTEPHRDGRLHAHALIHFDPEAALFVPTAREVWEDAFKHFGRSKIEVFDEGQGATHYVSKYVAKRLTDWDIQLGLRTCNRTKRIPAARREPTGHSKH